MADGPGAVDDWVTAAPPAPTTPPGGMPIDQSAPPGSLPGQWKLPGGTSQSIWYGPDGKPYLRGPEPIVKPRPSLLKIEALSPEEQALIKPEEGLTITDKDITPTAAAGPEDWQSTQSEQTPQQPSIPYPKPTYQSPLPWPLNKLDEAANDSIEYMANGLERAYKAKSIDEKLAGLHEIMSGFFNAPATPFLLQAGAASPLRTGISLGLGIGAQKGVQAGAEKLGAGPGTSAFSGDVAGLLAGTLGATLPRPRIGFKSTLPPIQQEALGHLQTEGVPISPGVLTGSKMLRALETTTGQMPYGAQAAGEFLTKQSEAMTDLAQRHAEQIHPMPVTPFDIGEETTQALGKEIKDLSEQEKASYDRAWQNAKDPNLAQKVQVGVRTVPASGLLDASGNPVSGPTQVPIYKNISQPVDISWLKPIAAEELPKIELQPAATQAQSAAASIFKKVLTLDDKVPAQYAEEMLKGFKEEAGYDVDPNMRNYVQGMAGSFVPRLENAIADAVGPESAQALSQGRRLHWEKTQVDDLRKGLGSPEPVQRFRQMVQSEDGGAMLLGKILDRAPDLGPRLGRAWFDQLLKLASREGDWRNQGTIFNKWFKLGDRTKAMMFPEEGLREGLDRFFLGQKITGIPINPSGTALVAATQAAFRNPLSLLVGTGQGFLGSKVFFTPRGIRLLVKASENPAMSPVAAAALRTKAERIAEETPPEEPPEGGPSTGGGAPPGATS